MSKPKQQKLFKTAFHFQTIDFHAFNFPAYYFQDILFQAINIQANNSVFRFSGF